MMKFGNSSPTTFLYGSLMIPVSLLLLLLPTTVVGLGKIPIIANLLCGCFDPGCTYGIGQFVSCMCDNGSGCTWSICCPRRRRRLSRSLLSDTTLEVSELDDTLLETCGSYEYEISIFLEDDQEFSDEEEEDMYDVYAIVTPLQDAVSANCPMLVTDNGHMEKQVSVWNKKEDGQIHFQDAFVLGNYQLADIITAYQKVDKIAHYRDYLVPMAQELQIQLSSEFSSYLTQKKWKSSHYVHDVDEIQLESSTNLDQCGEMEYDVSLYVDNHMYVIATPAATSSENDAVIANNCPPLLASHAVFGDVETSKQMLIWNTTASTSRVTAFETALPVGTGTYKLTEYVNAYQQAHPGHGSYEIVTNNCGDFVANMGMALGIVPTREMSTYIVRNLMEHTDEEFMEQIRTSESYNALTLQDYESLRQLRTGSSTTSSSLVSSDMDLLKILVESRM